MPPRLSTRLSKQYTIPSNAAELWSRTPQGPRRCLGSLTRFPSANKHNPTSKIPMTPHPIRPNYCPSLPLTLDYHQHIAFQPAKAPLPLISDIQPHIRFHRKCKPLLTLVLHITFVRIFLSSVTPLDHLLTSSSLLVVLEFAAHLSILAHFQSLPDLSLFFRTWLNA